MKKTLCIVLGLMMALCLFASCGSAKLNETNMADIAEYEAQAAPELAYTEPAYDAREEWGDDYALTGTRTAADGESEQGTGPATGAAANSATNRKLIKDISASVETREFDSYVAAIEAKTAALGGHAENKETYDGGYGYVSLRRAVLVLRIPAAQLEEFKGALDSKGKVTSLNESVRDITSNYTDVQTHIKALQTERDALLKLMEQAGNLEDLLKVQEQLTEVRYELDKLETQMRQMEDQIALSTVTLQITEVERITPEQPVGFWASTWQGFQENLFSIGRGIRDFTSGLLSAIPYLVLIAVPVTLLVIFLLRRRKRRKR